MGAQSPGALAPGLSWLATPDGGECMRRTELFWLILLCLTLLVIGLSETRHGLARLGGQPPPPLVQIRLGTSPEISVLGAQWRLPDLPWRR